MERALRQAVAWPLSDRRQMNRYAFHRDVIWKLPWRAHEGAIARAIVVPSGAIASGCYRTIPCYRDSTHPGGTGATVVLSAF